MQWTKCITQTQRIGNDNGAIDFQTKVAIYEWVHTIGKMHQQQRSDRGNFLEILYDNVPTKLSRHFDKEDTLDRTQYDVESISQYSFTVSVQDIILI